MTDPREIAVRLTEAQREALVECNPNAVRAGAGICFAFIDRGFLEMSVNDVRLTSLGLAVRAELEKDG